LMNVKNAENICENGGLYFMNKCLCLPGFNGEFCQDRCQQNHFGLNCQFKCPNNNCESFLICNQEPIGCSCASGYKGIFCNETCLNDNWGPGCKLKCNKKCVYGCDSFNGDCICKNNNTKGKLCEECVNGFYGEDCIDKCLNNCTSCDKINGKCLDKNISLINKTLNENCKVRLLNSANISIKNETINKTELIIIINNSSTKNQLIDCFFYLDNYVLCQPILEKKLSIHKLANLNSYHELNDNFSQRLCNLYGSENLIVDINSFLNLKHVDFNKNLISLELNKFNFSNFNNLKLYQNDCELLNSNNLVKILNSSLSYSNETEVINLNLNDNTTDIYAILSVFLNETNFNLITYNSLKVQRYINSSNQTILINCIFNNQTKSCINGADTNISHKHLELIIWLLTIVVILLTSFIFNLIIRIKKLKAIIKTTEFDFNLIFDS
jgi:hypothetical protein